MKMELGGIAFPVKDHARLFWEDWQGNPHEWHKATFDFEYLKYCLEKAGFEKVERIQGKPKGYDHGADNMRVKAFKKRCT